MSTVLAYILTFIAVLLPINASIIGAVTRIFTKLKGFNEAVILTSFILWLLISSLWRKFEGGDVPIAVLLGSIAILFISKNNGFNESAKLINLGERWGITCFGCWLMFNSEVIRWF